MTENRFPVHILNHPRSNYIRVHRKHKRDFINDFSYSRYPTIHFVPLFKLTHRLMTPKAKHQPPSIKISPQKCRLILPHQTVRLDIQICRGLSEKRMRIGRIFRLVWSLNSILNRQCDVGDHEQPFQQFSMVWASRCVHWNIRIFNIDSE